LRLPQITRWCYVFPNRKAVCQSVSYSSVVECACDSLRLNLTRNARWWRVSQQGAVCLPVGYSSVVDVRLRLPQMDISTRNARWWRVSWQGGLLLLLEIKLWLTSACGSLSLTFRTFVHSYSMHIYKGWVRPECRCFLSGSAHCDILIVIV